MNGTLISGTTRIQDTLPAMKDALYQMANVYAYRKQDIVDGFNVFRAYIKRDCFLFDGLADSMPRASELADDANPWWESEEAQSVHDYLFDALDACAPKGYYFGSHPDDGADLGFWECEHG